MFVKSSKQTRFGLTLVLSLLCPLSLYSAPGAIGAAPELKPVLKSIDPSLAKLDTPPPVEEAKPPPEDPADVYNRSHPVPNSGTYGAPGGNTVSPYTPSTNPNDRRNQVFTPPWAKQAPQGQGAPSSPGYAGQAPAQVPYGAQPGYQNQPQQYNQNPNYNQNPAYGQGGYQGYQNNYQSPYQNQNQYQGGGYRPNNLYQHQNQYQPNTNQYGQPYVQQPYVQQPYVQQPVMQAQPTQNQVMPGSYQPPQAQYNPNAYIPNRQNTQNIPVAPSRYNSGSYGQPAAYSNPYQPPSQPVNRPGFQSASPGANAGFPSVDMIPEFGKPLPVDASRRGPAGGWTTGGGGNARTGLGPSSASVSNSPEERVARLEKTAFGSEYPEHDVEARLDHLEKEIFGSTSSGSVSDRLGRLEYKLGGKGAFNQGYSSSGGARNKSVKLARNNSVKTKPSQSRPEKVTTNGVGQAVADRSILEKIPYDKKAGDYYDEVKKFPGNSVARWTSFPVKLRIPEGTPETWKESLDSAIAIWSKYLPISLAERAESADVELTWVNHLSPNFLGVTRLSAFNGQIKVRIYLLRPTYYVSSVQEKELSGVFIHQLGHALGIFGHSQDSDDTMYLMELKSQGGKLTNRGLKKIGQRDLNTLRRIYESKPLPGGFTSRKPIEWS